MNKMYMIMYKYNRVPKGFSEYPSVVHTNKHKLIRYIKRCGFVEMSNKPGMYRIYTPDMTIHAWIKEVVKFEK